MQLRIAGAFVVAAAAYSLWLGLSAVLNARDLAGALTDLAPALGQSIDAADFLLHWRVVYALYALAAATAMVAGVAMILRKRWSTVLLLAIAIGSLTFNIVGHVTGYIRYGFEGGLKDLLVLMIATVLSLVLYLKWPHASRDE